MKHFAISVITGMFFLVVSAFSPGEKPILLVTTDIGGDPDDQQSLTRLLMYSNEFDIRGLIASASGTRGELGVDTVKDQLIHEYIHAYAKVYSNLVQHAYGYPVSGFPDVQGEEGKSQTRTGTNRGGP